MLVVSSRRLRCPYEPLVMVGAGAAPLLWGVPGRRRRGGHRVDLIRALRRVWPRSGCNDWSCVGGGIVWFTLGDLGACTKWTASRRSSGARLPEPSGWHNVSGHGGVERARMEKTTVERGETREAGAAAARPQLAWEINPL